MKVSRLLPLSILLFASAPMLWSQSTLTGKIAINIKITLATTPPASSIVACSAQASVNDPNNTVTEKAAAVATISGPTATCNMAIPYSWSLLNPSSDIINLSYTVSISQTIEVPGPDLSSPYVVTLRSTNQTIGNIQGVPANGTTTVENIAARI